METIRIIHNLPRSGGSIISKSISAQNDVILLSEIHPDGMKFREKMDVESKIGDPLYQFQEWYNFFSIEEYKKVKNSNLNFLEKIITINKQINKNDKILVIRDWAFVDFFGRPFADPLKKNSLIEILSKHFEIKSLFLIRDPLETFISCMKKLTFFGNNYSFDKFLEGYDLYLQNIEKKNAIDFEKFTKDPDESVKKMCSILNINFNPDYKEHLKNINITGDNEAINSSNIFKKEKIAINLISDEQKEKINKNQKFIEIIKKLNNLNLN